MGIAERKKRYKDKISTGILDAALKIVAKDGWESLSMRRIAEHIEYSVPVIYEYFESKDALLSELYNKGFLMLYHDVSTAGALCETPVQKLNGMWQAYWNFAFSEKIYYQLMFSIGMQCCTISINSPESAYFSDAIKFVIRLKHSSMAFSEDWINTQFYTCWSAVHGLIAINFIHRGTSETINKQVLLNALDIINCAGNPVRVP